MKKDSAPFMTGKAENAVSMTAVPPSAIRKSCMKKRFCAFMTEKDYILANLSVCLALNRAAGNRDNAERIRNIMEEIEERAD